MYVWEFMRIDDLCKLLILDPLVGFETRKISADSKLPQGFAVKVKKQFDKFFLENCQNPDSYLSALRNLVVNNRMCYKLNIQDLKWFEKILKCYIEAISIDSKFQIVECNRYAGDDYKGVMVIAKKDIKKHQKLDLLTGFYRAINHEMKSYLESQKLDFSLMESNMKKKVLVMLGPAALINHNCIPNCEYHSLSNFSIIIKTIKDIKAGEELCCYYGSSYFGEKNEKCACITCEKDDKGFFTPVTNNSNYLSCESTSIRDLQLRRLDIKNETRASKIKNALIPCINSLEKIMPNNFHFKIPSTVNLNKLQILYKGIEINSLKVCSSGIYLNNILLIDISKDVYQNILNFYWPNLLSNIRKCLAVVKLDNLHYKNSSSLQIDSSETTNDSLDGFRGFSCYKKLDKNLCQAVVKLERIDVSTLTQHAKNQSFDEKESDGLLQSELKIELLLSKRNGRAFCIYCDKIKTQLPRHLRLVHSDQPIVKKIILGGSSDLKKSTATFLRNQGYGHLKQLTGLEIPVKSIKKDAVATVIKVECSNCLAFFSKSTLASHQKRCFLLTVNKIRNLLNT